jgi:hypothetical protein
MGERGTACLAQNVDEAVCLEGLPCCEAAVAEPQDMWPLQSLQHFEMISNDFEMISMMFLCISDFRNWLYWLYCFHRFPP